MTSKAFVVGVDTKGLRYCNSDTLLLEAALSTYDYEIVKPSAFTKGAIQDSLANFFDSCDKTDTALLYFSGHAFLDKGKLQFLLADDSSRKTNLINITDVIDDFSSVKLVSKLVILDCCHAGGATAEWKPDMPDSYFILTASSLLETAKELDELKSSFLTYKICEFLNATPQHSTTQEGEIFLSTFFEWLKTEALNHNSLGGSQVPIPNLLGNQKYDICLGKKILSDAIKSKHIAELQTAIRSKFTVASLSAASSLSLSPKNLVDVFVEPILSLDSEYKTKSKKTISLKDDDTHGTETSDRFINLAEIMDSPENILVVGRKESGKTSLLRYVQAKYLERDVNAKVPIYVNLIDLPPGKDKIEKLIRNTVLLFELSLEEINRQLSDGNCVLLIDSVDFDNSRCIDAIKEFFAKYPQNKYIFTADENMLDELRIKQLADLGTAKQTIYIHSFRRKQIRELISKWFGDSVGSDEIEGVLSQVVKGLNLLHFPSTPLMISLILLVFECQPNFNYTLVNRASLIEKLLEFLLQKMTPSNMGRGEIDFRKKEHVLSYIAYYMEKKGQYYIEFTGLINVVSEYFSLRALVPPVDLRSFIQKNLIDSGVLVELDGNVSFRFSCFAEYFIAKYIKENKQFYDYIMTGERFLGYIAELDYLTGLERTNKELIENIGENLVKILEQIDGEKHDDVDLGGDSKAIGLDEISDKDDLDQDILKTLADEIRQNRVDYEMKEQILDIVEQPLLIDDKKERNIPTELEAKFFANIRLLAESLRNCELVEDKEFKRKHLHICVVSYQKLVELTNSEMKKHIENVDDVNELREALESDTEFRGIMDKLNVLRGDTEDGQVSNDETEKLDIKELHKYWEALSYLIVTAFALESLGTPSLMLPLQEEISDKTNDAKTRLLSTLMYADLGLEGFVDRLEKISKEFIKDDLYSQALFVKLKYYQTFSKLSKQQLDKIETILARILASKSEKSRSYLVHNDAFHSRKHDIQKRRLRDRVTKTDETSD